MYKSSDLQKVHQMLGWPHFKSKICSHNWLRILNQQLVWMTVVQFSQLRETVEGLATFAPENKFFQSQFYDIMLIFS